MKRVTVPWSKRYQIALGVVWVRERDFPDLAAPCDLEVLNDLQAPVGAIKVNRIGRYVDLEPIGAGRRKDDVYLRLELAPGGTTT